MARVPHDAALQARIESALSALGIGVGELARRLDVPLITLRRVRKNGHAIDATRHRINNGLHRLGIPDSSGGGAGTAEMHGSDRLRSKVIAALELLLESVTAERPSGDLR